MSSPPDLRPTWAEIDLAAFDRNVQAIASRLPSGAQLVPVLKANAYGHGAVELARRLTPERVGMIAVVMVEEALQLRRAGIALPILVLGPTEAIDVALEQRLTLGVPGPEELALICAVARTREVTIHLKLDSGMGRMGVTEPELPQAIELIRSAPQLRVEAIYTHFANADEPEDDFTQQQIATYERMLATLREAGIDAPRHHFANSAATVRGLVRPGDFARVGIALHGPGGMFATEPTLRWRTAIARLKELPAGHAIGYGTTFFTARPSRIATLPVGYADGYNRLLSNRGEVLLRGQRVPVVGRVSMDFLTIDVTDVPDAALGDEVVLLGDGITAAEIAANIGTIAYEVFCNISARVPRVYRNA